jgi:hypothetical protein
MLIHLLSVYRRAGWQAAAAERAFMAASKQPRAGCRLGSHAHRGRQSFARPAQQHQVTVGVIRDRRVQQHQVAAGVIRDRRVHRYNSTLFLRRGKESKGPFEELLLPPLLLALLLLQLSLLHILLQGSK